MKMSKYTPPKPAPLPADYGVFYESLNDNERALIELAKEKLGSSFIIQWSHMYKKWKAAAAPPQTNGKN